MSGELSVLNCTAGDIRITLDKDNPVEIARAKRMITDMLRRGYILAIQGEDGKLVPVDGFDEASGEYIVCEGALYGGDGGSREPPISGEEYPVDPSPIREATAVPSDDLGAPAARCDRCNGTGRDKNDRRHKCPKCGKGFAKPQKSRVPMTGTKATAVPMTGGG